jgi:hypothetical protein
VLVSLDRPPTPDDGLAALVLLERGVDARGAQGLERGLEALLADGRLEVAILTAREAQHLQVRTAGVAVDGVAGDMEEVLLALGESLPDGGPRLVERHRRAPKVGGQPDHEPPVHLCR